MPKFNKTNRTAEELVVVLKRKGLYIADEAKAINYIRNIGYYRLKAYFYPLYQEPKHKHQFKDNAAFDKVMNMYRFDRKLRLSPSLSLATASTTMQAGISPPVRT